MKTLIIDNDSKHIDGYSQFFTDSEFDVITKEEIKLSQLDQYNAIILSGSQSHAVIKHQHLYDTEIAIIKQSSIPIFGVCIGFELMVHAYGGTLKQLSEKIQEIKPLTYIDVPIFRNITDLVVYEGHRWIVEELPLEFIPLAYSDTGVEIIKHKDRFMYGVQFHPEVRMDTTNGYMILKNFLNSVERNINMQR